MFQLRALGRVQGPAFDGGGVGRTLLERRDTKILRFFLCCFLPLTRSRIRANEAANEAGPDEEQGCGSVNEGDRRLAKVR